MMSVGYLVINIDPVVVRLGALSVRWYGLAYVLAITIALQATLRYAELLGVGRERVWRLFLWTALAGLIGGRLYFDIQQPDFVANYLLHPLNLIAVWNGGMAYFGAIFAAAPTAAILARRSGLAPWLALDIAALFGAVGQMFGRLGNLVNGDIVGYAAGHPVLPPTVCPTAPCIGSVADPHILPWATAYLNPGSFVVERGVPYHPAAAYEILINLATLALLWPLRLMLPRQVRAGAFFCLYVVCYAIGQFLVFFARSNVFVSFVGLDTLKQAQWTALLTLIGISIFYLMVVRRWGRPWPFTQAHPLPEVVPVEDTTPPASPTAPPAPRQPPLPPAQRDAVVRQAEAVISTILRGGVLLSAAVIALGLILFLGNHPPSAAFPHTLSTLLHSLGHGQPTGIIVLGLVLLILTPVLRVAVSIVAFAVEQDWTYVGITSGVLLLLLVSIGVLGAQLAGHTVPSVAAPGTVAFLLIGAVAVLAGLVGAIVGLGGGIFIVPLLTTGFGLPVEVAVGASIVSVIATSSGAAAAYVRDHLTNLRVGMLLELATTLGAIGGALLALVLAPAALFFLFGLVLFVSAIPLIHKLGEELPHGVTNDGWSTRLRLAGQYPDAHLGTTIPYAVTHVPLGFGLMGVAGLISGLLGIGSGTFKVLAMDTAMRLPMKVSTTTSNFMIGVTAAASAGIYFQRGAMVPLIAAPVALGVLLGALVGAKVLPRLPNTTIRKVFIPILLLLAGEMLLRGVTMLAAQRG